MFDGTFGQASFQVGSEANQTINFSLSDTDASQIGVNRVDLESGGANAGLGRATAATSSPAANNTAAATLTVTGSTSTTASVAAASSAREVAASVNGVTSTTGVSADARTSLRLSTLSAAGNVSFTLTSDTGSATTAATISATVTSTTDLTTIANAINAESGSTGVQAVINSAGSSIDLISENGDDILLGDFLNSGGGTVAVAARNYDNNATNESVTLTSGGNDSTRVIGEVQLSRPDAFSVQSNNSTVNASTAVETSTLSSASSVDISTVAGSQSAIGVIDGAIQQIDSIRADLGAVQNRLNSTISNLQNVSENVSAARSRVRDADFAAETAELTRNQILQQAGIAVLAQANAQPQSVLSLLQ